MIDAAVGFRAKTGRAIAVVLSREGKEPRFVWRGEVRLVAPDYPHAEGPYHPYLDLPWKEAIVAVQPLVKTIEDTADEVVRRLVEEMRGRNIAVRAAGVVGSPPKSLERIGNEHIRAHAAEGILFRRVLEEAAKKHRLPCLAHSEDELKPHSDAQLLKRIGKEAGPPWRADERMAATVAWMALRSS